MAPRTHVRKKIAGLRPGPPPPPPGGGGPPLNHCRRWSMGLIAFFWPTGYGGKRSERSGRSGALYACRREEHAECCRQLRGVAQEHINPRRKKPLQCCAKAGRFPASCSKGAPHSPSPTSLPRRNCLPKQGWRIDHFCLGIAPPLQASRTMPDLGEFMIDAPCAGESY
jgi:hypothetical protein